MSEKTLIERLVETADERELIHIIPWPVLGKLYREAADALSDRDARIAALEAGFRIIAEGTVSSGQDGHYLAHRHAVKIARALLTPTGTEIKDE